ncbi:MAG: VIT1/CCC1 transporter family protein [Patescibacteria group bacterium]
MEHKNPDNSNKIKKILTDNTRDIVFGFEDGFVSTLGTITGIAAATYDAYIVILSGAVLILVESVSMAAGSYLSSKSQKEVVGEKIDEKNLLTGAVFMGVSYLTAGSVVILPYLLFRIDLAIAASIILTIISLFLLGAVKGEIIKKPAFRSGLEMLFIAFTAAAIGFFAGQLINYLFTR